MSVSDFLNSAEKTIKDKSRIMEVDIETPFVDYCKKCGCLAIKLVILNKRGWPDRTTLCPGGRIFFIEFKRKNKSISSPQSKIRKTLERLGFKYYICDTIGQAEEILDEFLLMSNS